MAFLFLIFSFLLLVFARQILLNLIWKISGPNFAKTIYFLLFFPGIIIHEMSHFLVATLLMVPTGEISLFPEEKGMGSIQIAKTDPIREAIIGLAPTIIGTTIILLIFLIPLNFPLKNINLQKIPSLLQGWQNLFWLYLIFVTTNTMFASESDRRSWLGLIALIVIIASLLYLFNLLSVVIGPFFYYAAIAANFISTAYISTFFINLIFIAPLFIFQLIIEKVTNQ